MFWTYKWGNTISLKARSFAIRRYHFQVINNIWNNTTDNYKIVKQEISLGSRNEYNGIYYEKTSLLLRNNKVMIRKDVIFQQFLQNRNVNS